MSCKGLNRECVLRSGHAGKCRREGELGNPLVSGRNHGVTIHAVTRNQCAECAEKDAEIARLKGELARLARSVIESAPEGPNAMMARLKPKRDRAGYMRKYRAGGVSREAPAEKGTVR